MTTLDLNDFTTVFNDDFTKDTSLNTSIWNNSWGSGINYWFSDSPQGLLIAGQSSNGYAPVGFMQSPSGTTAGEGYGLFQFTGNAAMAGQGAGICFVLWRADNQWLDSALPNTYTELDILESWDGTQTGQATDHYYDPNVSGNDGQTFHGVTGIDLTKSHTYSMLWQPGSLTYYVDGTELYQITGADVPKDAADGGCNYCMGAEVVNENGPVGLYIQDMSYSTLNSGTTGNGSGSTGPSAPASSVALSAPGTASVTTAGATVSVTETATVSGTVTSFYEATFTSAGKQETSWQQVTVLNGKPTTFTATFANSGDYVEVVDNTTSPTFTDKSAAITINEPVSLPPPPPAPATITLSAPGSVQEASVGAGVTVTETAAVTGTSAISYEVMTASGTVETAWKSATVTNGTASFSVTLDKSGDYIQAVDSTTAPTVTAKSSAVTITDPTVTPANGTTVLGQSAASSQFAFSVVEHTSGSAATFDLDVTKAMGGNTTLREWLDGKYLGTLWDGMPDGSNTIGIPTPTAGAHTLLLTLDGSTVTATATFTVPTLSAAASATKMAAAADFTTAAGVSTTAASTGSGSAATLPTTGGSASDLLAVAASTQTTTALHTIGQSS